MVTLNNEDLIKGKRKEIIELGKGRGFEESKGVKEKIEISCLN